jgi:hypothetical protein
VGAILLRPQSRGQIQLQAVDPLASRRIQPHTFSQPEDIQALVAGMKLARRLALTLILTAAFRQIFNGNHSNTPIYKLGRSGMAPRPLPGGMLLAPRLLSNLSDAPYTGETALLFVFTRRPLVEHEPAGSGNIPLVVYFGLFLYASAGTVMILLAAVALRCRRGSASSHLPARAW